MGSCSDRAAKRRIANSRSLDALLASSNAVDTESGYRVVRQGNGTTIFTIGYERRNGDELIARLIDAGVRLLVDVRERPISRKPDFRKSALEARCEAAGLLYQSWTELGSTEHQRGQLRNTGDFSEFKRRFRDFARRSRSVALDNLGSLARKKKQIALICYERLHEECHRSIIADLVADRIDATVVAII